jgi:phosphate transport system protein
MSKHLQRDLEHLEKEILAQSSVVEEMVEKACRGLREFRAEVAANVMDLEASIDDREIRIEEECLKILALHQPVAVDLRRAATILKINGELERIADLAVNIAERTESLIDHPEFTIPQNLDTMARMVRQMVHDALDAFVNWDSTAARDVCLRDDEVDAYNREVIRELRDMMQQNSGLVEGALHFFSAARQVERIGDHATNIAEDVIYLVEGEIARHRGQT